MKHAYLIIAHNNQYNLEKLLSLLDYKYNDLYIHIDKKFKDCDINKLKKLIKYSNIKFIKRMDIRWSDYTQIKCEIELLKEATKIKHKYYHLLSGVDLPIKTQEEIHNFFNKYDKEFIHYRNHSELDNRLERINYYHLFFKNARNKSKIKLIMSQKLHSICLKIQKKFNINRIKLDCINKYRDGANWFSITQDLAEYIVSKEKYIKKHYKYTYCADEVFLQSIVFNSEFYNNLYSYKDDDYNGIKRLIDWNRGSPYTFTKKDFKEIKENDNFFVRKVGDNKLTDLIFNEIKNKKKK